MAAVHIVADKYAIQAQLAKEKKKMAAEMVAVHTAVDKHTSHPKPTKKVHWEETSK